MLHKIKWLITVLLIGFLMISGCGGSITATTSPARCESIQDQFIARLNAMEGPIDANPSDPELRSIVAAYRQVTINTAVQAKQAKLVVLDESGNILKDVLVDIRRVRTAGFILTPHLEGDHESRVVSEEFIVKWPRRDSTLELKFVKQGYRSVGFAFRPPNRPDQDHDDRAKELLTRGYLREPTVEGDPMRVVMPPCLIWPPVVAPGVGNEDFPSGWAKSELPKRIEVCKLPIVTSDQNRTVAVTKRGTYALVDRHGNVKFMVKMDKGNLLGLRDRFRPDGSPNEVHRIVASYLGGSSKYDRDPHSEPYQWQFYAEPRLIPPEEVRAGYERIKNRPPIQGRQVPNEPSTAPAKQP